MHATGHEVIHQVVTFGYRIEYVGDAPGFFRFGYRLVAKVCGVIFHGLVM